MAAVNFCDTVEQHLVCIAISVHEMSMLEPFLGVMMTVKCAGWALKSLAGDLTTRDLRYQPHMHHRRARIQVIVWGGPLLIPEGYTYYAVGRCNGMIDEQTSKSPAGGSN